MDIKEKHEKFLYPVVRIFSQKAAGSGTIIYSKPYREEDHLTLVLTNFHVIEDCVSHKRDWSSLLKRQIDKEFLEKAYVEVFSYVWISKVDSSNRYGAQILAYDHDHDLAILQLDSPKQFPNVATLIPKDEIKNIKLFTDIVVSGCSLAHEPFCNFGQITFLNEEIERRHYLMTNANSIFGNSGGAVFLAESGELIGVPSRITGIQLGFGHDIVTWMGFAAHPDRIYEFLTEQELLFVFDPKDTYDAAMDRRKKKQEEALMALKAEFVQDEVLKKSTIKADQEREVS